VVVVVVVVVVGGRGGGGRGGLHKEGRFCGLHKTNQLKEGVLCNPAPMHMVLCLYALHPLTLQIRKSLHMRKVSARVTGSNAV
jgi:hypothetical protein